MSVFVGPVSSSACSLSFVEWKITERQMEDQYMYVFEALLSCYVKGFVKILSRSNVLSLLKLITIFYSCLDC